MAKLHVPPPEGADDRSDVNLAILVAVGCIGLGFYGVAQYSSDADVSNSATDADQAEMSDPSDPLQQKLQEQRRRSEELKELPSSRLESMEWTEEDRVVALRFGPREATEVICAQLRDSIVDGSLEKTLRLELEKTLDRRTEFAPWACMTRLYLAEKLPEGDLRSEMDEFWGGLKAHEGNARIPISFLADFRETRDRPETSKFWTWVRMCAADFDYQAGTECRRLLHQISPAQGGDMLEMIEKHWAETGIRPADMPIIVGALGRMARNGQPHNWQVKETEELPDYDVDFRQAAVGYLCRLVNTPTPREREGIESKWDDVPVMAAEELRRVGRRGARAYEERLLYRWRETCRLAFGGQGGYKADEEYIPVPLLAVWDGDLQSDPDYRIARATELGSCSRREDHPSWICLADAWTDESRPLDQSVAHYFIETRYMEWDDSFASPKPEDEQQATETEQGESASEEAEE